MAGRFVQGVGWVELPTTGTIRYVQNQTTVAFPASTGVTGTATSSQVQQADATGTLTISGTGSNEQVQQADATGTVGAAAVTGTATSEQVQGSTASGTAAVAVTGTGSSEQAQQADATGSGGQSQTQGGHWLSPAQVKAEQKRQRKLEKARSDRWERERLDTASIADHMRAALSPAKPAVAPIVEDDEDDDEILLLVAA